MTTPDLAGGQLPSKYGKSAIINVLHGKPPTGRNGMWTALLGAAELTCASHRRRLTDDYPSGYDELLKK